ncbi:MAG: rRNA maturation RNase YbeY [Candidatus Dadabacteria bacterium]|nr:MAG: rRNA maturation RNase YbeY [Candidatus Dadabacteria bacterium]
MPVEVNASGAPQWRALLAKAARLLLEETGRRGAEFSVTLVGDEEMCSLNRRYRGVNRPTDVLAFAQSEGEPIAAASGDEHLGDVIISTETARRQAEASGWPVEDELVRLLVHGYLHLIGYDHEASRAQARRMRAEETRLARLLAAAGIRCAG